MKGAVFITKNNKKVPAQNDMWLNQGEKIETGDKSFARLVFVDKTSSNLGPNSELEIKQFEPGKPGLLNIIKGQIRSKVSKDVLNKDKTKLYLKTKTAAMGVRGTDFHIIAGDAGEKTTVLTYEGSVAMVQFNKDTPEPDYQNFEKTLVKDASVLVTPGRFSSTSEQAGRVNEPVKVAPSQLESLKKNFSMSESNRSYASESSSSKKAITPPGISPKTAFKVDLPNSNSGSEETDSTNTPEPTQQTSDVPPPPEGMFDKDSGKFAPPAGGFIDLKTGNYIEPPKGAQFDPVTETFVVPKNFGDFDEKTGQYLPPPPEPGTFDSAVQGPSQEPPPQLFGEYTYHEKKFNPDEERSPASYDDPFGAPPPPPPEDGGIVSTDLLPPPEDDLFGGDFCDLNPCVCDVSLCDDFNDNPVDQIGLPTNVKFNLSFPQN